MHQDPEIPFRLPELPDSVGQIQPFPRSVVWTAGLIIAALGVFGLYQGFHGASSRGSRGGGDEEGGSGEVSAQAAVPIPANTQWSTLSGPAMNAPTAKAQSSASAANDDEDTSAADSAAPSAQSAAAESAAPAAESAAPPAPLFPSESPQPAPDQQ